MNQQILLRQGLGRLKHSIIVFLYYSPSRSRNYKEMAPHLLTITDDKIEDELTYFCNTTRFTENI